MLEVVTESWIPGSVVAGRYRLERRIGQGGMGAVWAARDEAGNPCALKVARTDRPTEPKTYERLLREARATSLVRHPNVVPVLAVVETDDGLPCLVMPLLEGESLRAFLARSRTLTVPACARLFSGIVAGLAAVHAAGIVHRDLKPENVFLHRGEPLLLDFGIAKESFRGEAGETLPPSLTSTGAVLGTPHYMAPEQIFGEKDVDARADVWALGLMLYEALTGTLPTHGEGFGQVMKRITASEFPLVSTLAPDVPPALARLVGALLAKDRAARPGLAEVAATLAPLAVGVSSSAPHGSLAPSPVSPYGSTALYVADPAGRTTAPTRARSSGVVVGALGLIFGACGLAAAAGIYVYSTIGPSRLPDVTPREAPRPTATTTTTTTVAPSASVAVPASASVTAPASATAKKAANVPPPKPTVPEPPQRHAVFDSGTGRYTAMGVEGADIIRAVQTNIPRLRACLPAPTDDTVWSLSVRIYWPKGGKRFTRTTAMKNGSGQETDAENAALVECAQKMFATFSIPDSTGQDFGDAGTTYLYASAGYYFRAGPPP